MEMFDTLKKLISFQKNRPILLVGTLVTSISIFFLTVLFKKSISNSSSNSNSSNNNHNTIKESTHDNIDTKNNIPQNKDNNTKNESNNNTNERQQVQNVQQPTPKLKRQPSLNRLVISDPINLPHSILINIFERLTFKEYQRFKSVNRSWSIVLCKLEKLWRHYIIAKWGMGSLPVSSSTDLGLYFKNKYKEEQKRIGFTPEPYIISIHEYCADLTPSTQWNTLRVVSPTIWWQKRLVEELNTSMSGVRLELDERNPSMLNQPGAIWIGKIMEGNNEIGKFRFIDFYDAKIKFENCKWITTAVRGTECPWVGNVLGFFNFSLYPLHQQQKLLQAQANTDNNNTTEEKEDMSNIIEFIRSLTYQTRGVIANVNSGVIARSVLLESCKLKSIFTKYGMNDGDCLLDTDLQSNYLVSLIEELQKFLDRKGIGFNSIEGGAKVNLIDHTSHNPIRCSGNLPVEALSLEMPIWIYNTMLLNNHKLWGRKLE